VPILLVQDFRSEVGDALIRLGMKLKGNADSVQEVSAPESGPSTAANNGLSSRKPNPESPSTEVPKDQVVGPAQSDAATSALGAAQPNDSSEVSPHSKGLSRGSSRSASVQRLWSEIGKGNVSAEVELAQLYVKGDGVRKNCEQARVLLQAASKEGNTEAQHQLRNLKKSGCR
jgi:hypothetical protein